MHIAKKITITSYDLPESNPVLQVENPLKEFGEYFFDGEVVYLNTHFEPLTNTGDPYATVADWYSVGYSISKDLDKFNIAEYLLDLDIDKKARFDFSLGLYQGVWKYDEDMNSPWKISVEAGLDTVSSQKLRTMAQGMYFARNFVMLPNQVLPVDLSQKITKEFANTTAKVERMGQKEMEENKLLACLAVNQGSKKEPQFITVTIPAQKPSSQNLVVVGKCLYDVGGLALKDGAGQREMFIDKGGAATSLGLAKYFCEFPLADKNLIFLLPAVRNEISDTSYYNGETIPVGTCFPEVAKIVEIGNTDAEGRLTLADGVAWAQVKYNAKQIITIATLTGASIRSHGAMTSSVFCNHKDSKNMIESSFVANQEQAEFFPYRIRYNKLLVNDYGVGDLSNISLLAQEAGHHTAAEFVRKFVKDDVDLIHIDLAGPIVDKKHLATGYGVRSLVGFIEG